MDFPSIIFPSITTLENADSLSNNRDSKESEPTLEEAILQPISNEKTKAILQPISNEKTPQQPIHRSRRTKPFPHRYDEFVTKSSSI